MSSILVVAPHPDDETLGCGGTILRHVAQGDAVHWCIATTMHEADGYTAAQIAARDDTIARVADHFGFAAVHRLGFPAAGLDRIARSDLVGAMSEIVSAVAPERLYLPHPADSHSDHRLVFEAAAACTKWFRHPSITTVLAYETLSETGFGIDPTAGAFRADLYIDVSAQMADKLSALALYGDEFAAHPFPRSAEGVRALATLRGGEAGCEAAEAFTFLRGVER